MKKLFLTSGMVLCIACSGYAATDIPAGASTSDCTYTYLGSYTGPVSFQAKWKAICSAGVGLDSKLYTSSSAAGIAATTAASPTTIYIKYNDAMYSNNTCTTGLTNSKITVPTLTGYVFSGFYNTKANSYAGLHGNSGSPASNSQMITSSGTITDAGKVSRTDSTTTTTWYARWTPNTATVAYNCGTKPTGASTTLTTTAPGNATATYSVNFSFATPTSSQCKLPGYTGKWVCKGPNNYTGGLASDYAFGGSASPWAYTGANGDTVTCTANWTANTYTVTYTVGTGCTGGSTDTNGATFDASYTVKTRADASVTESTGYHFTKWSGNYTSTNGSGPADYTAGNAITYKVQNNLTLTAVCPANETTVTYSCGSGADISGTAPSDATATYNSNFAFAANPSTDPCAKEGYVFDGWTCKVGSTTKQHKDFFGGSSTSTLMTAGGTAAAWKYTGAHAGTVACTAHYTANTINLTWTQGYGNNATLATNTCVYGGGITLPSDPTRDGYEFDGWTVE